MFKIVKGIDVPLPDMGQIRMKEICVFFQYMKETSRDLKDKYIEIKFIKFQSV